jgi:malate dehydrogenase (oxaloacetate-decarboxylating)(NADP+)
VITLAGIMNYCLLCKRDISTLRVVINGAGAAGIRIADMCKAAGVKDLIMCDSRGVISTDRQDLNGHKQRHACPPGAKSLSDALVDAHVFVGVSVADCVSGDDVKAMADYPAIFAMSNPDPEISPAAVAAVMGDKPYVMATGRSDYPNQINNVLGFPFLFRGALDVKASTINTEMKVAASRALAELARTDVPADVKALYPSENLTFGPGYIIPKPFDKRLFVEISYAVAEAAVNSGVAPATDLTALKISLEERNAAR